MKNLLALCLFVYSLLASAIGVHAEEQRIVVVAGAQSTIKTITSMEVRRAYLGAVITIEGFEVRPLLNQSDTLAQEMFLQKTLFMSAPAYERQILSRIFRGGAKPPSYTRLPDLLEALQADPNAITIMRQETAAGTPGVKIVGNL